MDRCETCRWWNDQDTDDVPSDLDTLGGQWGTCSLSGKVSSLAQTFTFDPYDWKPLFTRPDFGCVQHEPSEGHDQ